MAAAVQVSINGERMGAVDPEALSARLSGLTLERAEIRLEEEGGASLSLLKSGDRALLMFLREPGDAGMTSRAGASPIGSSVLEFTLGNGQVDEYPAGWTVSFDEATRAASHFWTHREPAPFIAWHDDR